MDDVEGIIDVKIRGWKAAYQGIISNEYLDKMKEEQFEERLRMYFHDCNRIVYQEKEKILGFCMYGERQNQKEGYLDYDGEICALYVDPEYKRKGIGRQLLQYALSDLKENGKHKVILWCLDKNIPSRNFYKAMGGKELGSKVLFLNEDPYLEVSFGYELY